MAAKRRRRRAAVIYGTAALAALAAVVVMCARPARVAGVSDSALAQSAAGDAAGHMSNGRCQEIEAGRPGQRVWRCALWQDTGSGPTGHRTAVVEVGDWGCWTAKPAEGFDDPAEFSGCIGILDYVFE